MRLEIATDEHRQRITVRMGRARAMLRSRNLSMVEVGCEKGYDDPAYFGRLFKQG